MQFPVPQFTEVEDKIIGPLSLKQFGIIFGAGMFVFLGYTAAGKSLAVLIVLALVFGIPALGVAFVKYNGRPIYNTFGKVFAFISSDKVLIFHKEILSLRQDTKLKNAQVEVLATQPKDLGTPESRLKEVRELLLKKEAEEKELLGKIR